MIISKMLPKVIEVPVTGYRRKHCFKMVLRSSHLSNKVIDWRRNQPLFLDLPKNIKMLSIGRLARWVVGKASIFQNTASPAFSMTLSYLRLWPYYIDIRIGSITEQIRSQFTSIDFILGKQQPSFPVSEITW